MVRCLELEDAASALLNCPVPSPARIRAIRTGGSTPCRRASDKVSWMSLKISLAPSPDSPLASSPPFSCKVHQAAKSVSAYAQNEYIHTLKQTHLFKPVGDHVHIMSENVRQYFWIGLTHGEHLPPCFFTAILCISRQ